MANMTDTQSAEELAEETVFPLTGTRAQLIQRLQIGFGGLAAMLMVLGLASVVTSRVIESDDASVPDAAPTVQPKPSKANAMDPLAEAGVAPKLATEAPAAPRTGTAPQAPNVAPQPAPN